MKLHKGLVLWILVLTLSALVAGCVPQADSDNSAAGDEIILNDTAWTVIEMNGEAIPDDAEATLDFAGGQVGGIAFCNRFFGPYEEDGTTLSFGMLGSTMMACPNMELEATYLEALSTVTGYGSESGNLVLTNADGNAVLVLRPAEHAGLEGTAWHLTGYNTGDAISNLILDTEITATLGDGQIEGSAGCNSYFASYTLDGAHVKVGPIANTEMFCGEPEGVMDQELGYLAALATADTYEINRSVLTIFDTEGTQLLTFVAMSR